MKLAFIHRGSKTCRMLIEETGIPRYRRGIRPEVVINYGVAGGRFERWRRLNPIGRGLPMLNRPVGLNKYEVVKKIDEKGVQTPETRLSLDLRHNVLRGGWKNPFIHKVGGVYRSRVGERCGGNIFNNLCGIGFMS